MTAEAQRLAEFLDKLDVRTPDRIQNCVSAAALLRRQEEEIQEQCRLNGSGVEREARLRARIAEQEAALMQAREALERVAEAMPFPVATKTLTAINELLGEQT